MANHLQAGLVHYGLTAGQPVEVERVPRCRQYVVGADGRDANGVHRLYNTRESWGQTCRRWNGTGQPRSQARRWPHPPRAPTVRHLRSSRSRSFRGEGAGLVESEQLDHEGCSGSTTMPCHRSKRSSPESTHKTRPNTDASKKPAGMVALYPPHSESRRRISSAWTSMRSWC